MSTDFSSLASTTTGDIRAFTTKAREAAEDLVDAALDAARKLIRVAAGDTTVPALTWDEAATIPFLASKAGPYGSVVSAFAAAASSAAGASTVSLEVATGLALAEAEISMLDASLYRKVAAPSPSPVRLGEGFSMGQPDETGVTTIPVAAAPSFESVSTAPTFATIWASGTLASTDGGSESERA